MLHHVSLEIPPDEADRSIEFWSLLGFEEVPAADVLGDSVRWLEHDGTQIHLILTEGHTAPALGHAAVVATDHAESKQRLRDAKMEIYTPTVAEKSQWQKTGEAIWETQGKSIDPVVIKSMIALR